MYDSPVRFCDCSDRCRTSRSTWRKFGICSTATTPRWVTVVSVFTFIVVVTVGDVGVGGGVLLLSLLLVCSSFCCVSGIELENWGAFYSNM